MKKTLLLIPLVLMAAVFSRSIIAVENDEITPYKFTDRDNIPFYNIPAASRFITKRPGANKPNIVYYLTKPKKNHYPIVIVCGGSSSKEDIGSIIHVHRYLLKEFLDLGVGVLTVEQWGVDGNKVNKKIFMEHYTRSQRLHDHQAVIEHLKLHPPQGWNGELIFLGMTYKYHADALLYSDTDYKKIRTPFLVVSGVKDTFIHSSDAFVKKARSFGVNITYIRVEDMDHYVRKRPDIIAKSLKWLGKRIH